MGFNGIGRSWGKPSFLLFLLDEGLLGLILLLQHLLDDGRLLAALEGGRARHSPSVCAAFALPEPALALISPRVHHGVAVCAHWGYLGALPGERATLLGPIVVAVAAVYRALLQQVLLRIVLPRERALVVVLRHAPLDVVGVRSRPLNVDRLLDGAVDRPAVGALVAEATRLIEVALRVEGRLLVLGRDFRDVLVIQILELRDFGDVIEFGVLAEVVGQVACLRLCSAFGERLFLASGVAVVAGEDGDEDDQEDHAVEGRDEAEDHVDVGLVEELAQLEVDDAADGGKADDDGHSDASDHLGDALDRVALHGHDDHEAARRLEHGQEVGVPAVGFLAEHVGAHHHDLEDQCERHENLRRNFVGELANEEDEGKRAAVRNDVLLLPHILGLVL